MPLYSYGINHQVASLEVREQLAFDAKQTTEALRDLLYHEAVNEAVLVSTCNRTEIYSQAQNADAFHSWLKKYRKQSHQDITPFCYVYQDIDCVRHLMRVACGLDSMVLGEPEILGQIKQAYRLACETGGVGEQLKQLFPTVFAVSKQVRHQTNISANPMSLAYVLIQLTKQIFSDLRKCKVLLIGAGAAIELIATHLCSHGIGHLTVANRTLAKAQQVADVYQGHAIRMQDIPVYIGEADIVVSATSNPLPIIGKGLMESMLKNKKRRPIFMADLAVPRDIEPEVAQLEDVYLYNLDDFQRVIAANLNNKMSAAQQAEAIIVMQAEHTMRQLQALNVNELITQFRRRTEQISEQELSRAMNELHRGRPPEMVLATLTHQLTNKFLHHPTVKLRQAAYDQQAEFLLLAKELLGI